MSNMITFFYCKTDKNEIKYIDLIEKMKNLMRNESVQNFQQCSVHVQNFQ